ncbi:uncharacterized protein [Salvelinus alpinus]|uniref:uncharacterized protein n=1 Tax=Salvelinus alpinus TaxID=8036 RepID=UPI0039FD2120
MHLWVSLILFFISNYISHVITGAWSNITVNDILSIFNTLDKFLFHTCFPGGCHGNDITPTSDKVFGLEGEVMKLSCSYSSARTFQWYHQYPGLSPIFLLLTGVSSNPSVVNATPPYPRLSVELNKERTRVDLDDLLRCFNRLCSVNTFCASFSAGVGRPTVGVSVFSRPSSQTNITFMKIRAGYMFFYFEYFLSLHCIWNQLNLPCGFKILNVIYVLCFTGVSSEQVLTPYTDVEVASERDRVTLSCNYTSSGNTLLWYRQYPNSAPQLLVTEYANITPGFILNHDKNAKRVDLKISSVEVTDSALYYCALKPTVTGNLETLYKNVTSPESVFLLCSSRFNLTIVPSSGVNMHPFYCVMRRSLVLHLTYNEWN